MDGPRELEWCFGVVSCNHMKIISPLEKGKAAGMEERQILKQRACLCLKEAPSSLWTLPSWRLGFPQRCHRALAPAAGAGCWVTVSVSRWLFNSAPHLIACVALCQSLKLSLKITALWPCPVLCRKSRAEAGAAAQPGPWLLPPVCPVLLPRLLRSLALGSGLWQQGWLEGHM